MHKFFTGPAFVGIVLLAGCGGSKPAATTTPPPPPPAESPCIAMAAHMRELVVAAGKSESTPDDMLVRIAPVVERVMSERCQADAWTPEVIACINAADEEAIDPCIDQLTDEQEKAVEEQLERDLEPVQEEMREEMRKQEAPGSAPPPSPAPPDDPCGGGA